MHIASIQFHYGPEVAAGCYSDLWFNKLGGLKVEGPSTATKFLTEVLEELWKPQMISFIMYHVHRALNKGSRSGNYRALQLVEDQQEQARQWSQAEHPFSWK